MNKTVKIAAAASAGIAVVAIGATSFAQAKPAAAVPNAATGHGKHRHHRHAGHPGVVEQIATGSVVVAFSHHGHVVDRTFSTTGLYVRAGYYPSSPAILKTGEPVQVMGGSGHAVMVVLPVANGKLAQSAGNWTIQAPKATLSLSNGSPTFYGMSGWTAGTPVMAFGTRQGSTVANVAIAAHPQVRPATVAANQSGVLTLKTGQGTVTYTPSNMPTSLLQRMQHLKVGTHVVAVISPTNQVLMVRPVRHQRAIARYGVLNSTAAGQVSSVSSTALTLNSGYGSSTVNLSGYTVKVQWPHHAGATVSQLTNGLKVVAHKNLKTKTVVIRVIG